MDQNLCQYHDHSDINDEETAKSLLRTCTLADLEEVEIPEKRQRGEDTDDLPVEDAENAEDRQETTKRRRLS